jgi:hypothetical protein
MCDRDTKQKAYTMIQSHLKIPKARIAAFCQHWKVAEMALFGSVLREDFGPASDVDVLVSFMPEATWGLFDLATMQEELEAMLEREVDLVSRAAVEQSDNYIRSKHILNTLEVIYVNSTQLYEYNNIAETNS